MEDKNHIDKWRIRTKEDVDLSVQKLKTLVVKGGKHLDSLAESLTKEAYTKINCLDCGNCCRTSVTDFSSKDITRASKYLGISKKKFISKYLMEDIDGNYITITSPCPFLNLNDNKCEIYEVRPYVCDSYPHTNRSNFSNRFTAHKNNLDMCPITFFVVQKMWESVNSDK